MNFHRDDSFRIILEKRSGVTHSKDNARYFSKIKKQKKLSFNDKKHIIKMQFHNLINKFN